MRIFLEWWYGKPYVWQVLRIGGFPEIFDVAGGAGYYHEEGNVRVFLFQFMHFQCRPPAMNTRRAKKRQDVFAFCKVNCRDEVFVGSIKGSEVDFVTIEYGEEYVHACNSAYQCSWSNYFNPFVIEPIMIVDDQADNG